jgi:hypothetical protein
MGKDLTPAPTRSTREPGPQHRRGTQGGHTGREHLSTGNTCVNLSMQETHAEMTIWTFSLLFLCFAASVSLFAALSRSVCHLADLITAQTARNCWFFSTQLISGAKWLPLLSCLHQMSRMEPPQRLKRLDLITYAWWERSLRVVLLTQVVGFPDATHGAGEGCHRCTGTSLPLRVGVRARAGCLRIHRTPW